MSKSKKSKYQKLSLFQKKLITGAVIILVLIIAVFIYLIKTSSELTKVDSNKFIHSSSFKDHLIISGIDVSAIQGKEIDWNKVKRSGVDFVILRAGYTDYNTGKFHKDIMFDNNAKEAKNAGLMVGAYMFSQATSAKEAKEEAEFLVETVGKKDIQLPLVMDYELADGGRLEKALNAGKLDGKTSEIVDSFCSTIEDAGYDSMLYGNYTFLTRTLDIEINSERTNIWIAHYTKNTDFDYPYLVWQSTDKAKIPGIKGHTDMDFLYLNPSKCNKTHYSDNSKKRSLSDAKVFFNKENRKVMHLNKPVEPSVYVKFGIKRLRENKDYSISYINNSHEGTGYVVITGKGKYKDTILRSFEIKNWI